MARYLLLCWRDSSHPQGGGSERYLEHIGRYLAASGHEVVFRTAKYRGAPRTESAGGVTFRRGGRRLSVYPRACLFLLRERAAARMGRREAFSAVIDTQNGVPFFAATFSGAPTVVLTHHCHREQWPVAGPVLARIGWWIESRLSPRVHRRRQWLTVSRPSAAELATLGVPASHIAVIRNGVDPVPAGISAGTPSGRAPGPRLVVLSRLVPHKHVEDALSLLAELLPNLPDLHLDVIGGGWWEPQLRKHADALGVSGATTFHGHVSEHRKHEILRTATVHLMPSRKEGWGLAVMEAGQHRVPTIGYTHAAGLRDSIDTGRTGILVDGLDGMIAATRELLADRARLERMGEAARDKAAGFTWESAGAAAAWLLSEAATGRVHSGVIDPPADSGRER